MRRQRPAFLLDGPLRFFSVRMLAQIDDGDISSLSRVKHRHGAPDAGIAAGDERNHVLQLAGPLVVRRTVHRLDFELSLDSRLSQVLLGEVRRVIALPGLHRLVFLILRCARCFLAVNLFLDMQPRF